MLLSKSSANCRVALDPIESTCSTSCFVRLVETTNFFFLLSRFARVAGRVAPRYLGISSEVNEPSPAGFGHGTSSPPVLRRERDRPDDCPARRETASFHRGLSSVEVALLFRGRSSMPRSLFHRERSRSAEVSGRTAKSKRAPEPPSLPLLPLPTPRAAGIGHRHRWRGRPATTVQISTRICKVVVPTTLQHCATTRHSGTLLRSER